jgi:hypothetical protein
MMMETKMKKILFLSALALGALALSPAAFAQQGIENYAAAQGDATPNYGQLSRLGGYYGAAPRVHHRTWRRTHR